MGTLGLPIPVSFVKAELAGMDRIDRIKAKLRKLS
jgi:hypothetical protein